MKTSNEERNKKSIFKPRNERGSITLFVLIAMLFLLTVGIILFISNMNNSTTQQQDKKKIQNEYNRSTNTANLDSTYNEQEAIVSGKIQIIVRDRDGNVCKGGDWTKNVPLTVEVIWPKEISSSDKEIVVLKGITPTTYTDSQIKDIILEEEGTYNIFAKINEEKSQVTVKIDATAPSSNINPNGGIIYLDSRSDNSHIGIQANISNITENGSGIKEIEYLWTDTEQIPNDAIWQKATLEANQNSITVSAAKTESDAGSICYLHTRLTDNAGNVSEIQTSNPFTITKANYCVETGSNKYYTNDLSDAVDHAASTGSTIVVLQNVENETSNVTIGKNLVIDLNGKTVTMANTLTNNGTLDIYSSADGGTIIDNGTNKQNTIANRGIFTTNKTSSEHTIQIINNTKKTGISIIYNAGSITLNNKSTLKYASKIEEETGNRYVISNADGASTTVNGATLLNKAGSTLNEHGIANVSTAPNARIIINSGTIETTGYAIWNNGGTGTNPSAVEINGTEDGTKIISTTSVAISNSKTGTIAVNGGTIKGATYGISMDKGGSLNFNGGKIIGASHDKTYDGREVTFDVAEANVTTRSGYKPYTRQNGDLYETVLEKEMTVTADAVGGAISATNGWTIAQDGKTATKGVLQNTSYGDLPTAENNGITRPGYTFRGWYTEQTGGTEVKENTPVTSETAHTIYARWQANIYTITLDGQSATSTNHTTAIYEKYNTGYYTNSEATTQMTTSQNGITVPTRTGYTFGGYYTETNGGGTQYIDVNGTLTSSASATNFISNGTLYAQWIANTNTPYVVNHYVHDLGANTYTLNSTDNLTGTTDSTLTLANLKKTIEGATYVNGYLTGNTTKPTSGAVTKTTVAADGTRVINLYYRRNYLYVQYDVNGGALSDSHGSSYSQSGTLIAYNSNTKYWKGVYGSTIGGVTSSTYAINTDGLHNYNNSTSGINIVRDGYKGQIGAEWNLSADGTGTAYSQKETTYNANDMATAAGQNLANGDVIVTLYVNWKPTPYTITYELDGGTNNAQNPATYTIESSDITLQDPTKEEYIFRGWTGEGTTTPTKNVVLPHGSTGNKTFTANWSAANYSVTAGGSTYYYLSLKEAVEKADASDSTITVLQTGFTDTSEAFTVDKNVTINTNGKTATMSNAITVSSGKTLTISGSGTINTASGDLITNNGTVVVSGANLEAGAIAINGGNVTVTSGSVKGGTNAINTSGANTVTIGTSGGSISTTSPVITGTTGSAIVMTSTSSTFNFYDGKIAGKTPATVRGVSTSYDTKGTVNYPAGYGAHTAQNSSNGNLYETTLVQPTLSLSPETMYLGVGTNNTGTITVTKTDCGTITFTSSDPTIATVNSSTGVVTSVKYGTATITATDSNSGKTATITVKVDDKVPTWTITVKSIT